MQRRGPVIRKPPKAKPRPVTQRPSFVAAHGAPVPAARARPRPTPKQISAARAQERAYASQGRAVKRVARRQAREQRAERRTGLTKEQRKRLRHPPSAAARARAVERAYAYTPRKLPTNVPESLREAQRKGYLEPDVRKLKAAGFTPPGLEERLLHVPAYAAKDIGELAVGTPTSLAHLGVRHAGATIESVKKGSLKPTIKAAEQTGKEFIEPYKQLVKDPVKFATEHPVTTGLMVAPVAPAKIARIGPHGIPVPTAAVPRAADLAAGRVARAAGKQTLRRPDAVLEGTTIRVRRTGSRAYTKRRRQAREDVAGSPQLSTRPGRHVGKAGRSPASALERRVDEFYDRSQQHKQAAVASKALELRRRYSRKERKHPEVREQIESEMSGAAAGARQHVKRELAHEFGSHLRVVTPKSLARSVKVGERAIVKRPKSKPQRAPDTAWFGPRPNAKDPPVGRGFIDEKGNLHTWNEDEATHVEMTRARDERSRADLIIRADGTVVPVGGRPGVPSRELLYNDYEAVARAVAQDPRLKAPETMADSAEFYKALQRVLAERKGAEPAGKPFALKVGRYEVEHTPQRDVIVKDRNAPEGSGAIYETKAEASKVAEHVPWDATVMEIEGQTAGVTGGYAVVPKVIADRYRHHTNVGTAPATGAVVLRVGNRLFRRAVLPMSVRWLMGQATEGALRSAVAGAGPISYLRGRKLLRAHEAATGSKALRQRTTSGGVYGATGPLGEFASKGKTLAEEFEPTGLANIAAATTRLGAKPGVRHIRALNRRYSELVFNDINGRIEQMSKTALLGKAALRGPLMERRIIGLSDRAIADAVKGLRGTGAQVELGRAVDRAYGKYSKFGPHARETILHTTPFVPWFLNMGNFLVRVLPADHPIATSLLANMNAADQEWRKANRLSYYGSDRRPDWQMGGYPVGNNALVQIGRYGPFAPGEFAGDIGGQIAPQYTTALMNLAGVDWKGQKIPGGQGRRISNAALSQLEALVPGVGPLGRITGLGEHYVRGQTQKQTIGQGRDVEQAIKDFLNPLRPIKEPKRKSKAKQPTGGWGGGSSGGGW